MKAFDKKWMPKDMFQTKVAKRKAVGSFWKLINQDGENYRLNC